MKQFHVKIYQIDESKDVNRRKFIGSDDGAVTIDADTYVKAFDGVIDVMERRDGKPDLEDIFEIFNTERMPKNHAGHSLSVSDIVVVCGKAFFCDSCGFLKVDVPDNWR